MKPNYIKIVFLLSLLTLSLRASDTAIDSLKNPVLWLEQQNNFAQNLLKNSQEFNKAVIAFKTAHDFAHHHHLSDQFTEITIGYGIAMYRNGDIQNAYAILKEILPQLENQSLKEKAEVNQILGMTLVFQNKFPEGYKYQMDALKHYSDMKDSSGLMSVYYDLGTNFGMQGQNKLALENYEKGITLAKALKDVKMTILGITEIGGAWASLKDFDKALSYNNESIELAKEINDDEELGWASINRGHILVQLKRYKEAETFLKQAYTLSFKIGNKLLTAYSLEQLSDMNVKQDRLDKAIADLEESYTYFQELGQINSIKSITKKYAEIYYKQGDFEKYKIYTDEYISLKDSLYSQEMMESMASLKQDYEFHKLERENHIAMLTKDKQLASAKYYAFVATICGAVAIFLLLIYLSYSRARAAAEKNDLLEAKNAEILRQNEILASSNKDLEKFAYIISHDLKEPLRNINGFTKLLSRRLKKTTTDESINEYATFITNGTEQMTALLTGLLEYSKLSINKSRKKRVEIRDIVDSVLNNVRIQLDEKQCTVKIEEMPNVPCRTTQMIQVFQNLIANALKFGGEGENIINIGCEDLGSEYRFSVKDNGIGIDQEFQKDIFIVFKRLHDRGTYSGSGIGLATCKKIVEDHGGRIWVESELGKGACFFFTLPKGLEEGELVEAEEMLEEVY